MKITHIFTKNLILNILFVKLVKTEFN